MPRREPESNRIPLRQSGLTIQVQGGGLKVAAQI
jgi:hypothetical protein